MLIIGKGDGKVNGNWDLSYRVHALIDESKKYRYQFTCEWNDGGRYVTFIMLNPSVGNQTQPDPTLRKCISYAKKWGYDGIKVANLFAYISTDPTALKDIDDPVGPENDHHILEMVRESEQVIVAWGQALPSPIKTRRIQETLHLLREHDSYCLERTVRGNYPKHPLFLKGDLIPVIYQKALET